MTWTATEREAEVIGGKAIDIRDDNGDLFCCVYAVLDHHAAIEQMRARARLIVQAEALVEALREIVALKETPFEFPSDWSQQIADCPECERYKDHPIQQGICNTHRQPMYEQGKHDQFEREAIGPRAKDIARQALPHDTVDRADIGHKE